MDPHPSTGCPPRAEAGDAALWSDPPPLDRGGYLRLLLLRTGVVLAAVFLAVEATRWLGKAWWPLLALGALPTLWWLGHGLRMRIDGVSRTVVQLYGLVLVLGGAGLCAAWFVLTSMSWLLAAGVVLVFIGSSAELTTLRRAHRDSFRLPVVLAVLSALLALVAATGRGDTAGRWPIALLALAVGAAYLALTLGAEPWIRHRPALLGGWRDIALGLVLAAGALGWLALGAGWRVLVIGALVAGLTVVTTADFDGELLLGLLLVVALFWATFPRDESRQDVLGSLAGAEHVVITLGDSYVSGEGARTYEDGTNVVGENVCRRSSTAWPRTFVADGTLSISLACSGARLEHLTRTIQYGGEPPSWPAFPHGATQLDQLEALLGAMPIGTLDAVVVGIGGNDLGFSQIGITCVGAGDCSDARVSQAWLARLPALRRDLTALYLQVRSMLDEHGAGDVELLVPGYPISLSATGCWWTWLADGEHRFLAGLIGELDATIAAAAHDAGTGVRYIPAVATAFEDARVRLCDGSMFGAGVNLLSLNPMQGSLLASLDPRHWVNNSFHPNEVGHAAISDAVRAWLADPRDVPTVEPSAVASPCGDRAACDAYIAAWSRGRLVGAASGAALPVAVSFAGCWLLVTALQRQLRAHRISVIGTIAAPVVSVARRVSRALVSAIR